MLITQVNTQEEATEALLDRVISEVKNNSSASFSLASGSSVKEFYKLLKVNKDVDFSNTRLFQMDDYFGEISNSELYLNRYTIDLAKHLNISDLILHKTTGDVEVAKKHYDNAIDEKPIDFIVLGLGLNGHLAYNEPGTSSEIRTHVVDLEDDSIANMLRYGFSEGDKLPTKGISIGLKDIYDAKRLYMIVIGESKKEILEKFLSAKSYDKNIPATILLDHPSIEIITDVKF